MPLHDMDIANQTFPNFRADLNLALAALAGGFASATAPTGSNLHAYMTWYDTANGLLRWYNDGADEGSAGWITIAKLDRTNNRWEAVGNVLNAATTAGFTIKASGGTTLLTLSNAGLLTLNGTTGIDGVLDEDNMASNDPLKLATQQSIKAFLDNAFCGLILPSASTTLGYRELECDGAAVSRTTYANLFSRIGTSWGVGDGSTTFNLPMLQGEFLRGWDNGRGVDSGRAFASAQLDQMQRITGNIQIRAINTGSPAIYSDAGAMDVSGGGAGGQPTIQGSSESRTRDKIEFDSADSPNVRASSTTSGETRSRNMAVMFVIKY